MFLRRLEDVHDLEYRRVKVRGTFDYENELFLSPRSLVDPTRENSGGGLITAGNRSSVGLWVVTPFQLSDRKERILVNRGWISRSQLQAYKKGQGRVNGEIELVGVVRRTEKVGKNIIVKMRIMLRQLLKAIGFDEAIYST